MSPKYCFALTVLLLACTGPVHADIFVASDGDDSANGSVGSPVNSAQRALELSVAQKDPTIVFADGIYYLDEPLTLMAEHSGTREAPRTLKAANEGRAILSAGTPVDVTFEKHAGEILKAKLPTDFDLSRDIDGLFVDGQQQRMARFPNYDRKARWLKGSAAEAFSPERIKTWQNPKGGFLHAMHPAHWGGNHWLITGKKSETECSLQGGWMNNRGGGVHPTDRFVENIFEELDTGREWYLDKPTRTLYWQPEKPLSDLKVQIVFSNHEACVALQGSEQAPVHHVAFEGISFRHTKRTFLKTKEPLLRSDWRIYRRGALYLEGCEDIAVTDCEFTNLGGNAYFASGYNRRLSVARSHFHDIGAGAIIFVGDTTAVYNPKYEPYGAPDPWEKINKKDRGPRTNEYPADCIAEDCLIHDIGLVEKQVAGLQISVAANITGRHLSIYDVPRAGINIGENAFGGHLIEFCDVFDTVQESSDHGSFNSWGRDRYWHTKYPLVDRQVAEYPELPKIDMLKKNVIRNSRWRCDHGWDIDLDDGSAWYVVENNLCLGGGIKLREGYYRVVRNNLIVANTFHPHVWFRKSDDVFQNNIVATPYQPIRLTGKGKLWDSNIFLTTAALEKARAFGVDEQSVVARLEFSDPQQLDFSFPENEVVTQAGFKPFDLTKFGVQKTSLKQIARTPTPPKMEKERAVEAAKHQFLGATFKKITTFGEASATGMGKKQGVHVLAAKDDSITVRAGIKPHDVILKINGRAVNSPFEFIQAWARAAQDQPIKVRLWRTQKAHEAILPKFPGVVLSASEATIVGSAFYDRQKNYIGRWTDPQSHLEWSAKLKPGASYKMLITQANPSANASEWKLTGLKEPVLNKSFQTSDWETFKTALLPASGTSLNQAEHSIQIVPSKVQGAVMNLRELILFEN